MKAFIMAAGKGTRMQSPKPKTLFTIGGKPIIIHTLERLKQSGIEDITVITGHKAEQVENTIKKYFSDVKFFRQENINGTGQAIKEVLERVSDLSENIIFMNADDSLFYSSKDIKDTILEHKKNNYLVSMFIVEDNVDRGYRKILLNSDHSFKLFTKGPSIEGYTVTNFYIFNTKFAKDYFLNQHVSEGELKITDFLYLGEIKERTYCKIIDQTNWFGINNKEELKLARKLWTKIHHK